MRKFFYLIIAALALYSGYWLIAAQASERGLAAWLNARAQEGWQSEYAQIETTGYPLAFRSQITDLDLADPVTGTAFSSSSFQVVTKSYAPTELTATFAPDVRLATPFQSIELTNTHLSAAIDADAGIALPLLSSAVSIQDLTVQSTLGWGFELTDAQLFTERHAGDALTHDIRLTTSNFAPSSQVMALLDPDGILSNQLDTLNIDTTMSFTKPWDISALEGPRPQPTSIKLHDISAQWGQLQLRLAGELDVDANGSPSGTLQIKAQNWRDIIALTVSAGFIPENFESPLIRGGNVISGLKGNRETLDVDLTLSNGSISMGFIPLGPAPRLVIH